jgi:hypothetical protein
MNKWKDYFSVLIGYICFLGFLIVEGGFSKATEESMILPMLAISLLGVWIFNLKFNQAKFKPVFLIFICFFSYWIMGVAMDVYTNGFEGSQIFVLLGGFLFSIPLVLVRWEIWAFAIFPLVASYLLFSKLGEKQIDEALGNGKS